MIGLQAQANLLFVETDPGFTFSGDPRYVPSAGLALSHQYQAASMPSACSSFSVVGIGMHKK